MKRFNFFSRSTAVGMLVLAGMSMWLALVLLNGTMVFSHMVRLLMASSLTAFLLVVGGYLWQGGSYKLYEVRIGGGFVIICAVELVAALSYIQQPFLAHWVLMGITGFIIAAIVATMVALRDTRLVFSSFLRLRPMSK